MGVHLVTGKAGAAHITGESWGALNAAIVGNGDYIASGIGGKLAVTLATTNKVHVADGMMFMQGRQIMVEAGGVDLVIENGAQGQKRNDLVVMRYEKSSAGIESGTLRVAKGTPTSGTPADPTLTKGNILTGGASVNEVAIARVSLDGITPSAPVRLIEEIQSAKDAWDSVSRRVLYENPSGIKGNFKLAESAANFARLTFYFKNDDGLSSSVDVDSPDGKTVALSMSSSGDTGYLWFVLTAMDISGASCSINTKHAPGQLGFYNSGALARENVNHIAVTKVVGHLAS